MLKPEINVTPLIDVLLVLLIIFMVVAPLKPDSFKAKVPSETKKDGIPSDHQTLVVTVESDSSLSLDREPSLGNTLDPQPLVERLKKLFDERASNGTVSSRIAVDPARPFNDRVERTVFIKAPRRLDYGSVARVIDAVNLAGAYPISLQIDYLE